MMLNEIFNPKKTLRLFGHDKNFNFFKELILNKKLPKVLMLNGEKGIGKFTLVNHLMYFYFDKLNYDKKNKIINDKSSFYIQFTENLFSNIIYLNGSEFKNIKIEEIRKLKNDLLKTQIKNDKRFVILDDVDSFNSNSLNALLKIIEEPNNNYFILINNKSKPVLETIKSRCIKINLTMNKDEKIKNIYMLLNYFKQKAVLENNLISVSPGLFLKFNFIFNEKKIDITNNFLDNLNIILNLHNKDKNNFYRDLLLFYTEYYLAKNNTKMIGNLKLIEQRSLIIKDINDFFLYNVNQNSLIRSIERRFG